MLEKQYTDIFNEYRATIDKHAAPCLNNKRDKALKAFEKLGFPTKKQEDYHYFDVASEFMPDYALNLNRVPMKGNPYFAFACNAKNLYTDLYYNLNDLSNQTKVPDFSYPKGVFVGSLKDFALEHEAICEKYFGEIAQIDSDAIAAFNTMFVQDGFVIYVPKNTVIESPIQLINILKSDHNYLVNRRILIIAEDNAQVKLLACDHTVDDKNFLVTQVNEIFAGKNAHVDYYDLEENSKNVTRITSTYVHQEADSNVLVNSISLTGGKTRNNIRVKFAGQHAETYACSMIVAGKDQVVDNFVHMNHAVPNCTSTQLFKYVLQENSIGSFCGRILVAEDAQKTLAYQSNNNLCVSNDAKMYSKPQLEIYADDVKCSHGLTTGQLDIDALFYLRARGINEEEAKLMLIQAFASDVLEHIRIDALKERLNDLLAKRLKGEQARCGNCEICK